MTALNKKSLHAVIDALLERGGSHTAIEAGNRRLDYVQLDRRSRRLAWQLKAEGIGPGVVVALPLPASIDYVVALLATVRAGGIALPLDPGYPAARLARIFHLAAPRVLLTPAGEGALAGRLAECADGAITLLALPPDDATDDTTMPAAPPVVAGDDDTGYLIHTSGSTGTPKLIAGRNKGVSHFVHWEVGELGLDTTVRASFFAPPTFDVSLREIFVPLLAGGTLVIPDTDERNDAARLVDWLRAQRITLMHAVPSLFRLLTRALRDGAAGGLPELRHACLAGEPLYGADVAAWRAVAGPGTELVNLYGPSETTLAKAFHRVDRETYAPGAIVPIGQPIANTALLILRNGRLADIGEPGEIHIRTPFASNGYWGDPQRTGESFVANPLTDDPADRIYRTGDLGRYRPDRSVEFIGRADRQVKVDGVRIELPEIEGALRAHPDIEEAAAQVFRLADGSSRLVGYYAGRNAPAADAVRAHLAGELPAGMLPGVLVALPALPKNLNGKVDRKALPRPEALLDQDANFSAPQGETEQRLARLWAEALGLERIGAESPWLAVGGNSLRAIGLIGRIHREFGIALTIRDFLERSTIRAQAKLLEHHQGDAHPPLVRIPDTVDAPVTDAQQRLWILSRLDDGQTLYNNVEWLELEGPLDRDALRQAFQALVARHESLRTVFVEHADGSVRQRVVPDASIALPCSELPPGEAGRAALEAALAEERDTAFDLATGPLLRLRLLRVAPEHHHLLVTMHHIVCDGWSMALLTSELAAAYAAARSGHPFEAPLPEFRPRDVAVWLEAQASSAHFARCRDYWATRLADVESRAVLPPDTPRPSGSSILAGRVAVPVAPDLEQRLRDLLAERQATPFLAIACAFATLLYRYGGSEQVVLGTPVAGRDQPGLESVVGFCVNTLPLVLHLSPEASFAALLDQAGRALADLHAHQALPFETLLGGHGDARDPLTHPLFEAFLAIEPAPRELPLAGLTVTEHELPYPAARYDLSLRFAADGARWRILIEYRESLWHAATMERFARHLANLLGAFADAPDQPLAQVAMLDAEELTTLEAWAQGPQRAQPRIPLGEWFARRAAQTPDAPALLVSSANPVDAPHAIDYRTLDRRANAFAHALIEHGGVTAGAIVGLLLTRGAEHIAALLGILKCGATVLPLDPQHPPARLLELLADAGAQALIADDGQLAQWQDGFRLAPGQASAEASPPPAVAPSPDAPAYLIYTSGSTGTPKGVLVSHAAFANMMADQIDALGVGPGDRVLQFIAPAFDAAMFEIFLALLPGATLAIADRAETAEAAGHAAAVRRLGATVILLTPGFLNTLEDDALRGLRLVITGGEAPIAADVRRCRALGLRYVNAYGPTETAVNAALFEFDGLEPPERLPLGRPTANCALRVVAPDLSPLPVGVAGELLVSGAGVALGYLHRPALTAHAFGTDAQGVRCYRSGDRCVRSADGALYFLGRNDGQVKVRGHRVELGEVEAAIRALPGVAAAHVAACTNGADRELVAWWTPSGTAAGPAPDLATALAARLPGHAVPSHFVCLDQFPLTLHGKIDAARLPGPQARTVTCEPPRTPDETRLVALWREVLDLAESTPVGRDSDFFLLGGRSLAANRLALRIARALGRPVRLRDLYAAPTPAALLEHLQHAPMAELARIPEAVPAPLSPMQRRLWIISRLGESGSVYHISGLTRLTGALDLAALRAAFADLCERQAVLRTRLVTDADGEPWQVTDPGGADPLIVHAVDAPGEPDASPQAVATRPFDLAAEWPLRVHLWQRGADTWDLLVVLHHLAGDGWSMPILERELAEAYNARRKGLAPSWPALPAQYRDVAAWMGRELAAGAHRDDAQYWREVLAGELPLLDLPTDRPRPTVRGFRGATHAHALPADALAALNALAERHQVTPFTVFLALVQGLLARLSGQDDLITGVPVAGRSHPASEALIGFFVNTLPLRAHLKPSAPFSEHLACTAATLRQAQAHQGWPFDRLVEELALTRDTARSPVFDVLISLDEAGGGRPMLDGVEAASLPLAREGARCDLWWMLDLASGAPTLRVEYDSDLFDAETVAHWCARLLRLIAAAHAAPATPLGALPWMDASERAALIEASTPPAPPLPDDTVTACFEAVAAAMPDSPALIEDAGPWRYRDLDHAANALAAVIVPHLPEPDGETPLVALMIERGAAMPLAMLASLKAGCAYLPIEPDSPAERVELLLADSGAQLLLHSPALGLPACTDRLVRIPVDAAALRANGRERPPGNAPRRTARDPVYVMYTSGSTGRPKGVLIEHRNVIRLVCGSDYYRAQAGDRLLQLSNYAFDGATFDFFAAFANGLPLALPERETVLDPARLAAFLRRHEVNVGFLTTALLNRLVDNEPEVLGQFRRLYFGGQEASLPHVRRAYSAMREGALVHVYGPTEVTTFSTWHVVRAGDLGEHARRLPIGRPIAHTRAHVVDPLGALQAPGVPGELWLGGEGVARGYTGQPELTAERFIASPFVAGDRLYRSGDLCLQRRDGVIEFLGRLDGQVKIRGYRIELGEIEGRLAAAPGVDQAYVLARPATGGNLELVAYLTAAEPDRPPTRSALHAHLARHLPPYMLPAHYVLLDELPVNENGKVDRRALPAPEVGLRLPAASAADGAAPLDAAQQALCEAWRAVLHEPAIGIDDNYFALGGDSIQALQIVSRLRESGWALKVTDLLRNPTIASLAPLIVPVAQAPAHARAADEDPRPPLTPIQHWFLAARFAHPQHFNQSLLLHIARDLDPARLQQAITTLWHHHAGLRAVFGAGPDSPDDGGAPWQRLLAAEPAPLVETVECADAAALTADAERRQRGFDPARGPLFAAVRYRLPDGDRLFLAAHHWVVDGVSWRILLEDLDAALSGRPLAPAGPSAGRWAARLAGLELDANERALWHQHASAPAATLPRCADGGPAAPLARRTPFAFEASAAATASLTASGHAAYRTQGDELLLAAWVLALARTLAGPADDSAAPPAVRITLESHGRAALFDDLDLERSIGWFTAMFPLRLAPSSLALPDLIREVKETLRAIPARGVGHGVLRWLQGDPVLAAAPPPGIGFNYLGRFDQDAALPVAPEPTGDELAPDTVLPHGLDVTAEIRGERLCVRIVADTARHPAQWCAALASAYATALEEVAAHCLDPAAGRLSPSDVDLDGIGLDELDAILDGLGAP